MRLTILTLLLLSTSCVLLSQNAALFFTDKNKNKQTYFLGSTIKLQHEIGYPIIGHLSGIGKDSIYITNYTIRRLESDKGFVFFDTLHTGTQHYGLNQIKAVTIDRKNLFFKLSAGTARVAAGYFSIMSIVNGIKFKDNQSTIITDVIIRGGLLYGVSVLFKYLGRERYVIGKRYKLKTMLY